MTYNPYWGRPPVPASKVEAGSKSVDAAVPAQETVKSRELPLAPGFGWSGWGWGGAWGWPGWGWGGAWGWPGWGWGWGWGRPWGPWI
jgi:hypothetical protein